MKKIMNALVLLFTLVLIFYFFIVKNKFTLEKEVWENYDYFSQNPKVKIDDYTNFKWDYFVFVLRDEYYNQKYFFLRGGRNVFNNKQHYNNSEWEENNHLLKFEIESLNYQPDKLNFYKIQKYEKALICNKNTVITFVKNKEFKNLLFLPDKNNCVLVKSPLTLKEYGVLE